MTKIKSKVFIAFVVLILLGIFSFVLGINARPESAYARSDLKSLSATSINSGTDYDVDYVPIEKVTVVSNNTTALKAGQSIPLDVALAPSYAIKTVRDIRYQLIAGTLLADINGNVLTVKPNATIGETIIVEAIADGKRSENKLQFVIVETSVESIKILNTETSIHQGASLKVSTQVLPQDATLKTLSYRVTDGAEYATVSPDGTIWVNDKLPAGDLTITVRATSVADESILDEKQFSLYVPTRHLSLDANHAFPRPGETIELQPAIDETATVVASKYIIISGSEFVDCIAGNFLTIKSSISECNPEIVLRIERDNIQSNDLTLRIYIPTGSLSAMVPKTVIKQGEMIELNVATNPTNATRTNLKYFIEGEDYASFACGILTAEVLPDVKSATVTVWAEIDDIPSEKIHITIEKPIVVLTASNYKPSSSSMVSDTISLLVYVDDVLQADGITYQIKSGSDYIDGKITNGQLKIAKSITADSPRIVLSAKYGAYETGDIIIDIKILVEKIELNESCKNIVEVEQQERYLFSGTILPINATLRDKPLTFRITDGSDYATIDKDGWLKIASSAPIGQSITVIIDGPDGKFATHTVKVKKVYATKIEVVSPIKGSTAKVGDTIAFTVKFSEPFNITDSVKVFSLSIVSGMDFAKVEGNKVKIINNNPANYDRKVVVRITSKQGDWTWIEDITINVTVPVASVELTAKTTKVNEGETITLKSLLNAPNVTPQNHSVQVGTYSVKGNATLSDDQTSVLVGDNLSSGNLTFSITLTVDGVPSKELVFSIFVKAKELELLKPTATVESRKDKASTVTLQYKINDSATNKNPSVRIYGGEKFLEGVLKDELGYYLPSLTFTVKKNLTSTDFGSNTVARAITLYLVQDGIESKEKITIPIYVPVETFSLEMPMSVDRGSKHTIMPSYNGSAKNFVTNPTWEVPSSTQYTRSGNVVSIEQKLTYNTTVNFDVTIDGKNFPQSTKIAALTKSMSEVFASDATNPAAFGLRYGTDSAGIAITSSARQLMNGCSADIALYYKGQKLSDYGLTYTVEMLDGIPKSTAWMDNIDIGVRLNIAEKASGKISVRFRITVTDGVDTPIELESEYIHIFRKISALSVTNTKMNRSSHTLNISGLELATANESDVKVTQTNTGSATGYSISGRTISASTSSNTANPMISFQVVQSYNGTSYTYESSPAITLTRRFVINRAQLAWMYSESDEFHLDASIDLSGSNWTPISNFSGTLYGHGYWINNMKIEIPAVKYDTDQSFGLFGELKGNVYDVKMWAVEIIANPYHSGSWVQVGGIAGYFGAIRTVSGCAVYGKITVHRSIARVGGIVGCNWNGDIESCENNAMLYSNGDIGGIVGHNDTGCEVSDCFNFGAISYHYSTTTRSVGGIIGYNLENTTVANNYNYADILTPIGFHGSPGIGGVIGSNNNPRFDESNYSDPSKKRECKIEFWSFTSSNYYCYRSYHGRVGRQA